jgi:hypothetical protein
MKGKECQRVHWKKAHKAECLGQQGNAHLKSSPFVVHPDPAWPKNRIDRAKEKFLTEYLYELQAVAVRGLDLHLCVKEDGTIDIEKWNEQAGENFVVIVLEFGPEAYGRDYQYFRLNEALVTPWSWVGTEAVVKVTQEKLVTMHPAYCIGSCVIGEAKDDTQKIYAPCETGVFTIDIATLQTHLTIGGSFEDAVELLKRAIERGHGQAVKPGCKGYPIAA